MTQATTPHPSTPSPSPIGRMPISAAERAHRVAALFADLGTESVLDAIVEALALADFVDGRRGSPRSLDLAMSLRDSLAADRARGRLTLDDALARSAERRELDGEPLVKACACGRCYSASTWAALESCGRQVDAAEALDVRNCRCGSTIAIVVPHTLEEIAKVLRDEGHPASIENTGGGTMVLFVPDPAGGGELGVTVEDDGILAVLYEGERDEGGEAILDAAPLVDLVSALDARRPE